MTNVRSPSLKLRNGRLLSDKCGVILVGGLPEDPNVAITYYFFGAEFNLLEQMQINKLLICWLIIFLSLGDS